VAIQPLLVGPQGTDTRPRVPQGAVTDAPLAPSVLHLRRPGHGSLCVHTSVDTEGEKNSTGSKYRNLELRNLNADRERVVYSSSKHCHHPPSVMGKLRPGQCATLPRVPQLVNG
jgi:hypothetical protein